MSTGTTSERPGGERSTARGPNPEDREMYLSIVQAHEGKSYAFKLLDDRIAHALADRTIEHLVGRVGGPRTGRTPPWKAHAPRVSRDISYRLRGLGPFVRSVNASLVSRRWLGAFLTAMMAHPPKVTNHRPGVPRTHDAFDQMHDVPLPLERDVGHPFEPLLPLHEHVVGPVHHDLGSWDNASLLRDAQLRHRPIRRRIRAWTFRIPATRRLWTAATSRTRSCRPFDSPCSCSRRRGCLMTGSSTRRRPPPT